MCLCVYVCACVHTCVCVCVCKQISDGSKQTTHFSYCTHFPLHSLLSFCVAAQVRISIWYDFPKGLKIQPWMACRVTKVLMQVVRERWLWNVVQWMTNTVCNFFKPRDLHTEPFFLGNHIPSFSRPSSGNSPIFLSSLILNQIPRFPCLIHYTTSSKSNWILHD